MKLIHSAALAALAATLATGAAQAQDMTAVPCGMYQVSLTDTDAAKVKGVTGEENFEKAICDGLARMSPSSLTGPNAVKVTLSDGTEFEAMITPTK